MENEKETGLDLAPAPEMRDKYADYLEINKESEQVGKPEQTKVESKEEAGSKTQEPKAQEVAKEQPPKKEHQPDYLKKINKQHAEIKELKARLERIEKPQEKKQEFTKENFATDSEYVEYLAEKKAQEVIAKREEEALKKQIQEQEKNAKEQEFKESWAKTVKSNFEGDEAGFKRFAQKMQDPAVAEILDGFCEEIHEYVSQSPLGLGARLLDALTVRTDLAEEINNLNPKARFIRLYHLESELKNILSANRNAPAQASVQVQKPISKAPAPIGQAEAVGSVINESEQDTLAYQRYMKKKFN